MDNLRVEVPAVAPSISVQTARHRRQSHQQCHLQRDRDRHARADLSMALQRCEHRRGHAGQLHAQQCPVFAGRKLFRRSQQPRWDSSQLECIAHDSPSRARAVPILRLQPDNSLTLTLAGDAGAIYFVETSHQPRELVALTNVSLSAATIQFSIGTTTNDLQRYFRARSAPLMVANIRCDVPGSSRAGTLQGFGLLRYFS